MTTLTEMLDIETARHDGVREPASGFPILMMKSLTPEPEKVPAVPEDVTKDAEGTEPVADETETVEKTSEAETEPQAEGAPEGAQDAVQEAVAKAVESYEKRLEALEGELAKVKATPLPGGPVVSVPPSMRDSNARSEQVRKAAYYENMAEQINEPDLKREYLARAAAAKAAAQPTP